MKRIDLAYLPIIGRGEQINIICAMHEIEVNYLLSTPLGDDFDKDKEAAFGTIPWMKDNANGLELNDSMAIVQYLVSQYPGPLTPENNEIAARVNMYWAWVQDYYSFVLSPFHDIIIDNNDVFWRNSRLTDSLANGGKATGISNLKTLHAKRLKFLEQHLANTNAAPFMTGEVYGARFSEPPNAAAAVIAELHTEGTDVLEVVAARARNHATTFRSPG